MAVNVTYRVYTGGRWLPDVTNLSDYAGIYGSPVQGVQAHLSTGTIQYRVHTINGSWLPWVDNRTDYAGIYGQNIDGLQMRVVGLTGKEAKYRVYVGGRWLPWVTGTSDYAGIYGQVVEAMQVEIVGGFDQSAALAAAGNSGIFKGLGIGFGAFDLWKGVAIVSLTPMVTVEAKVSLSPGVPSSVPVKSLYLGDGEYAAASAVFKAMDNANMVADLKLFNVSRLSDTIRAISIESNMNKYVTIGAEIIGTTVRFYLQGSFTFSDGTVIYQTFKYTITRYTGNSTVPIQVTSGYKPHTTTIMDNVERYAPVALCLGMAILVGAGLGYAAPAIGAYMMYAR